jgi:20S proteasome alpha/beta subunit
MTVCVATICDLGRALVLAADKMVGIGFVEAELDNSKIQPIHSQWFMMIAGEDIAPLFELGDLVRAEMPVGQEVTLEEVMNVVQRNYELIRMRRAEARYLKPLGWTIDRFNKDGSALLPNFLDLQSRIGEHELSVQLLVAGFDRKLSPWARIFTIDPSDRGIPRRHDLPGFAAIGSGAIPAEYMMHFKDVTPKLPIREAVYYALEAKYFGEYATGVGPRTDLVVLRFDGNVIQMIQIDDDKTIEKKLIPMCERLEPKHPTPEDIDVLNSLPELKGLPAVPRRTRKSRGQIKKVT